MLILTDLILPFCDYNKLYSDIHRNFAPCITLPNRVMTPNTREQVALAPVCSSITILKKARIDPTIIPGYEREVTTHIAVALAVKSGEADAGMCVYTVLQKPLDYLSYLLHRNCTSLHSGKNMLTIRACHP